MINYTPLPLELLCLNKILFHFWKEDFDEMTELGDFFLDSIWEEKFRRRHEIIKWCLLHEKNKIKHK